MLSLLGYKSFMIHIIQTFIALIIKKKKIHKASLSGGFMAQLLMHSYFGNSAEKFHPHKTISAPIKLPFSLSSSIHNTVPCQHI
jgi:hypothetical protein